MLGLICGEEVKCFEKGSMSDDQRAAVQRTLTYCRQHNKVNTNDITNKLNEEGMKAIVIDGVNRFRYHDGSETMEWATWDCGQHGKFTVICIRYWPIDDNDAYCYNKGSMSDNHRAVITKVLKSYCNEQNVFKCTDVTSLLNNEGMKSIIMKGDVDFCMMMGFESMTWARWNCGKFGKYTVLSIRYWPIDDNKVSCCNKGSMSDNHRDVITKVLKNYCNQQTEFKGADVRSLLNEEGMKSIVIRGDVDLWWEDGSESMTWAVWNCGKFGKFTVLSIRYWPKDDNDVSCCNEGSMSDNHRAVIIKVLKNYIYCNQQNEFEEEDITSLLDEEGMKSIVIRGDVYLSYHSGTESMTWAVWNCAKFGEFTVICIRYRPKNSNDIICINNGDMVKSDRDIVLKALRHCHLHQTMKPKDITKQLQEENIKSIVLKDNMSGFDYHENSDNICWSVWNHSAFGAYSVMFMTRINNIQYKTMRNPFVIIIGIQKYDKPFESLKAIPMDNDNMKQLWLNIFNYKNNSSKLAPSDPCRITKNKIVSELADVVSKIQLDKSVDGLIFVYSGHGFDNYIISSDKEKISLTYILDKFSSDNCPYLAGKPKIFYMDCCRGKQQIGNVKIQSQAKGSDHNSVRYINKLTDFMIHYATSQNCISWSNHERGGSHFINATYDCYVKSFYYTSTLEQISIKINEMVNLSHKGKQTSEIMNRLTYGVHIQPNI